MMLVYILSNEIKRPVSYRQWRSKMKLHKVKKRTPSVAYVLALVVGVYFLWIGLAEAVSGLGSTAVDWNVVTAGLTRAALFGLAYMVVVLSLNVMPKVAASILICTGVVFGCFYLFGNSLNGQPWVSVLALVGLPIILGLKTITREIKDRHVLTGI